MPARARRNGIRLSRALERDRHERQRLRPADLVALHEIDAHAPDGVEGSLVLDLLGDDLEIERRESLIIAVTIAWLTLSEARLRMKEPSIFR